MPSASFRPALIVVDVQEDFCPPNGSLAVPNGRDILRTLNHLLTLPFVLKVATKDWHPATHISFSANHPNTSPYTSFTTVTNPSNPAESYQTRLWPVHCVQNTPGAALVPELHREHIDKIVEKGQDARVEMYSAFYDPLREPRVSDSGLAGTLREAAVTDCFVVGLAADYCVKATALDAAAEGFKTWIVDEGTRAVDIDGWEECKKTLAEKGVWVVSAEGAEIGKVAALSAEG
ncbi:MAG: NAD(+) salvage pathway protein [Claussenomyces sp. TS43310]|nr:MAG: NAD(+) salvage pathway protein [Claussenomyces sp. TS43310]